MHVAANLSDPWDRSPTFAIVRSGTVIGSINLEVDPAERTAMLGYAIGRAWWRQGFATEAARAVLAWGIDAFALRRVWASADARNERSVRVLEKLGMRRETMRRADHRGRDGEPFDELVYVLDLERGR